MAGNYPHHLHIIDTSGDGHQDPNTKQWIPDEDAGTLYSDKCDAQEMSQKGLELAREIDGVHDLSNVLEIFLKDESNINAIPIGAAGTLTRAGFEYPVNVIAKRIIDGVVFVESNP